MNDAGERPPYVTQFRLPFSCQFKYTRDGPKNVWASQGYRRDVRAVGG